MSEWHWYRRCEDPEAESWRRLGLAGIGLGVALAIVSVSQILYAVGVL